MEGLSRGGIGVKGINSYGVGLHRDSENSYAGYFSGDEFWHPHRIRLGMRLRTNAGDGITPIGIAGVRDSANLKNIGRPGDQALN